MMKNRYFKTFIGMFIGFIIVSVIVGGPINWAWLMGIPLGLGIAAIVRKDRDKRGEVQTDERVKQFNQNIMIIVMQISTFLLAIYLLILKYRLNQEYIEITLISYYVFGTFFLGSFLGPVISGIQDKKN